MTTKRIDKGYIHQNTKILLEWGLEPNCIIKLLSLYPQAEIIRSINFFMVKKRPANEDLFLRFLKSITEVKGDRPAMYRAGREKIICL